jgi:serine/threonine protein kinase
VYLAEHPGPWIDRIHSQPPPDAAADSCGRSDRPVASSGCRPIQATATTQWSRTVRPMPFGNGQTFAGYSIVRLLGSGGMGEVYLAEHPRLPRRDALEVLPVDVSADPEYRTRFSREADLASSRQLLIRDDPTPPPRQVLRY